MTDPDEPFGRDMHQEPADEFFTGDGDLFPLSLVFVIFSSKGNSAVRHAFLGRYTEYMCSSFCHGIRSPIRIHSLFLSSYIPQP